MCIEKRPTFALRNENENENDNDNDNENDNENFFTYINIKMKIMKRRIIYVGTLIDLAAMIEPDTETDTIEVTNTIKYESYE